MKKSILAISEKKEILKQLRKELGTEYEILTFTNLLDAIDMLRESEFDLILLDQYLTWFNFGEAKKKLSIAGKEFAIIGLVDDANEETIKEMQEADIYSYLLKPVKIEELNKIIASTLRNLELKKEKRKLEEKLSILTDEDEIIGHSKKIKELKSAIEKVVELDTTVLIVGENGVGKGLVAREILEKSDRRKKPYVALTCASFSEESLERELFGYEKGAFPGAGAAKKGIIEEAEGGTIFLNEITSMGLKTQNKLLNAIEYGEFKRVGGTKYRKTDVKFIIATNKNLKQESEKGLFKKELYYRLTTVSIEIPPLRERKDDIPTLANYFLNKISKNLKTGIPIITVDAMKYIIEYSYPGNIIELKNILERAIILNNDKIVDVDDLPLEVKMKSGTVENKTIIGVGPLKDILENEIYSLDDVEKVVIGMALQKTRWNKQEASKLLGLGRTTLYEKIRKYNLDVK